MDKDRNNDQRRKYRKAKLKDKQHRLPVEKKYYDTFDMMQLFNVGERTLQRWRTEGKLPYTRMGGRIYYLADEVEKKMRENGGS